jgi:hypothetical protein
MDNSKLLARRLFHRLERGYYKSEYIVLNDGYYFTSIWADTEEEAIRVFLAGDYKKGGAA